jgi:hypothetical protein
MTSYRVVGAYCTAPVASDQGTVILGFQRGAILPGSVPQDHIDHLVSVNLVAEESEPFEAHVAPVDTSPLGGYVRGAKASTLLSEPVPEDAVPKGNATKEEWAAYAVTQGMPADEAEEWTRDELRDKYTP